jgi:Zn-dependent protease
LGTLTLTSLIARAIALLVAFTVHEASHAGVAYLLGDDTAQRQGRLTLNPLKHLDPFGAIMALIAFIGWAKPVPVSPWRLRYGPRVGGALVAIAGPLSNLVLAIGFAALWRFGLLDGLPILRTFVWTMVMLNIALFVFNLIPLAPLDGNSVLNGLVSGPTAQKLAPLRTYGPQILLGLLLIGMILPAFNILGLVVYPPMQWLSGALLSR